MDDIQRQHDQNILRPLTLAYKPQYYYWEFIILIRRILIAFLAISFGSNNIYPKFVLIIILCIFLRIQSIYQPFIIQEVNNVESNLLMCIIIIVVIDRYFKR